MNKIFVDTSAFFALSNSADQYHAAAVSFMEAMDSKVKLITTNFVLDEVVTRLRYKVRHAVAVAFKEEIQKNKKMKVITIDRSLEKEAWSVFKKYNDQKFSYTDCTSFACMKKLRIQHAFAFDNDFKIMGFSVLPNQ